MWIIESQTKAKKLLRPYRGWLMGTSSVTSWGGNQLALPLPVPAVRDVW